MIVNPNILNFDDMKLDSAKTFFFELELPDFDSTLSQMQKDTDPATMPDYSERAVQQTSNTCFQLAEARMNLIKSLQALAQKDKIPVKMRSIDDIRLLINSRELFSMDEKKRIKLDSLSKDDIEFFRLCSEKNEITVNDVNPKDSKINFTALGSTNQVSYKSLNFSKGLFNMIEYSFKKQKPVRLDFTGSSSVILRVNQQGKLSAEFISNDTAMEYVLRNSIPNLKNKLDSEGIPYEKIYYRDKQQKSKKDKGGKK